MVEFPRDEKIQQSFHLQNKRKKKEHIARWKESGAFGLCGRVLEMPITLEGSIKQAIWGYFWRALIDLSSPSQVAQEPDSFKDFMWEPTEVDLFHLD